MSSTAPFPEFPNKEYDPERQRRFVEDVWKKFQNIIRRLASLEKRSLHAYFELNSLSVVSYDILLEDSTVAADCTTAPVTVTLPLLEAQDKGYTFITGKIDVSANALTTDGNGANINGSGTDSNTTQWLFKTFQWSGTEWFIVASS